MTRVAYLVLRPIVFNLVFIGGQELGVLKSSKNDHFQLVSVIWVISVKFWVRLRSGTY